MPAGNSAARTRARPSEVGASTSSGAAHRRGHDRGAVRAGQPAGDQRRDEGDEADRPGRGDPDAASAAPVTTRARRARSTRTPGARRVVAERQRVERARRPRRRERQQGRQPDGQRPDIAPVRAVDEPTSQV